MGGVAAPLRVPRPYRPPNRRGNSADLGRRRLWATPHPRPQTLLSRRLRLPEVQVRAKTIPLSESLSRALWRLRGPKPEDALVFVSQTGKQIEPSNLMSRVLKPAARKAGVPWANFHTFRHTCATILFRHGLNAKQVQMWLGHHSPAFTLATYVHLLPDDLPDPAFLDQLTSWAPLPGQPKSAEVAAASYSA